MPCIEALNTKLSDRVGVLLAFLMDLNAIPGGDEVIIILEDRRSLNVHDCAKQLESKQIPCMLNHITNDVVKRMADLCSREW